MTDGVPRGASEGKVSFVLRPRHLALAAFIATLPASALALSCLATFGQFAALIDGFLFATIFAALLSSAVLVVRGLQRPGHRSSSTTALRLAAVVYLIGLLGFLGCLALGQPLVGAVAVAGIAAGAALPLLLAAWARVVAAPMDQSLALCSFVVLAVSVGGWVLTLLPPALAALAFGILAVFGTVPLLFGSLGRAATAPVAEGPSAAVPAEGASEGAAEGAAERRVGADGLVREGVCGASGAAREEACSAAEAVGPDGLRPGEALRRLASVTWLPLAGLAVYAFMTDVAVHSAFDVIQAPFLGGVLAALVVFGACLLWGRRPLLPWVYRVLVPLLAAIFVVLGSFPASTFPRDASVVALYLFFIVLALLGCALFLAVVHSRELPADVTAGFVCATATAAALLGQILSSVLAVTDDFGPWFSVLAGAFIAVLLVFLGRMSWKELVEPRETGVAEDVGVARAAASGEPESERAQGGSLADTGPANPGANSGASVQGTLEARCAEVAAGGGLSPREGEILVYLARGFSPTYVAKSLVLSVSTVRTHVRNIYRKLGVGKREELIHLVDGEGSSS